MLPAGLPNTNYIQIKIIILIEVSIAVTALFSTIECPDIIEQEISSHDYWSPLKEHCTLDYPCSNVQFNPGELIYDPNNEIYQEKSFGTGCDVKSDPECKLKLKVTIIDNLPGNEAQIYCPINPNSDDRVLLAHPENCSLFYKCNWSKAVLFECPEDLHFNTDLQICDWPWQAGCDETWTRCPRPRPLCPTRHSHPIYLPHPYLCDKFYQCSWGQPYLQNCPTGLHFNPNLKVCDWPHNAKCHLC